MKTKNISEWATHFLPLIIATLAIAFTNCSGDDDPVPEPEPTPVVQPSLEVSPGSIPADYAADTYVITVTSNTAWAVSSSASWSTPSPLSGNNNGAVTVTVTENTEVTERSATVTFTAGTLTRTVAVTQAGATPVLTVSTDAINDVPAAGNEYSITVTSNTAWAVSSNAAWSTPSPLSGSNNGAVTVTIAENTEVTERSATVTFTAGTLTATVTVTQAGVSAPPSSDTPPHAVSAQTWTFEGSDLVWSDRIQMAGCDDGRLTTDNTIADCRNNTYYNWPYVNSNKNELCPSPWRVPTKDDLDALTGVVTSAVTFVNAWGGGGFYDYASEGGSPLSESGGFFWSATEHSSNSNNAYHYYYTTAWGDDFIAVQSTSKLYGMPVRCVKSN
jgi:hypothetical protein